MTKNSGVTKTFPKPEQPFAGSPIAKLVTERIRAMKGIKSQRQIAFEVGYERPNIISMIKRGEARVPLDKIPALAKALDVDPALLFRLGMQQYWQDLRSIDDIFGTVVSKNELDLIRIFRQVTDGTDPRITPVARRVLAACFTALKENQPLLGS